MSSVLQSNYLLTSPEPPRSGTSPNFFNVLISNTGSPTGLRTITHQCAQALPISSYYSFSYTATSNIDLWAAVGSATSFLEIRTIKGIPLLTIPFSSTVSSFLISIISGETYVFTFYTSAALLANATLFTLVARSTQSVSNYFSSGFENAFLPLPSSVNITTDNFGQVTYNFTNYPLALGQRINLCFASFAQQNGQVSITSSNPTIFSSYSDPFTLNSSVAVFIRANTAATFTGTVTVGIVGVGTSSQVSLEAISISPYVAPKMFNGAIFSRIITPPTSKICEPKASGLFEQQDNLEDMEENNKLILPSSEPPATNKRSRLQLAN